MTGEEAMLDWCLLFLAIALIAAIFGFIVLSGIAAYAAQVVFVTFIVIFVAQLVFAPSEETEDED